MIKRPGSPESRPAAAAPPDGEALVDAAARHAVPEQVTAAFAAPYDPYRPDPDPGQLWRLEWDGTVALAVLTHVTGRHVQVAPVGDDPEFADPATVILGDSSPVGYPIGVWVGLERAVPRVALDLPIGSLDAADYELVLDVRHRLRNGLGLPDDDRLGGPLVDPADTSDPRIAYRLGLEAPFTRLAELFALIDSAEPVTEEAVERPTFGLSLIASGRARTGEADTQARREETVADALERAGVPRDAVLDALDLSRNDYLALVRGALPLTDVEVDTLARLLGRPAVEIRPLVPDVDPDLLVCLHEPEGRRDVDAKAAAESTTHTEARRAVVRDVVGALRRDRGVGRTDWRKILDDYFGRR